MRATWVLMLVLAGVFSGLNANAEEKKKIVFVAGNPSHGYGSHEHKAGCELLAKRLNESGLPVEAVVIPKGWPADPKAFDGAAAVVIFCDGGGGHVAMKHLPELNEMVKKGVGVGCIHYAVEIPKGEGGDALLGAIGGYFEVNWSVNPHWTAEFKEFPKHPAANGVKPFKTNDEWYYHMRFVTELTGVTPILTAVPPDSTRKGKDDAHGGNPAVRDGLGKNISEHVLWTYQRPNNGGRGFGCTGAHFHWNWASDDFRTAVLNSCVWIAGLEVPEKGVASKRPDADELMNNQDEKIPEKFDKEKLAKEMEAMNAK